MRRIKIAEAPPCAIDWLVAKVEGKSLPSNQRYSGDEVWINVTPTGHDVWAPSTDPAQGHPILEREVQTRRMVIRWSTQGVMTYYLDDDGLFSRSNVGPTMLIAGLRCFLVSRLGDEADVPEELLT